SHTTFTIDGAGTCALNVCGSHIAGAYTVTGTDGSFSDTSDLAVTPAPLASITLTPASSTIAADQTQTYTAEGFDAYGNSRGDRTAHTVFSITGAGTCAANVCGTHTAGSYTVTGTAGSFTDTSDLDVTPAALASITLSPASSTIAADQTQTYTAEGFDAYGNSRGDRTAHTVFSITGAGTCAANVCGSHIAGSYTVTGTDGAFTDTSDLDVTPAALASITLSPASSTIAADQTQTYTAEGFDAYGNSRGDRTAQDRKSVV